MGFSSAPYLGDSLEGAVQSDGKVICKSKKPLAEASVRETQLAAGELRELWTRVVDSGVLSLSGFVRPSEISPDETVYRLEIRSNGKTVVVKSTDSAFGKGAGAPELRAFVKAWNLISAVCAAPSNPYQAPVCQGA
ncbi:MAG: hypothetical protein U0X73_17525 [Thermoanaerobaculia bacterium]